MRVAWTGLALASLSMGCGRLGFDAVEGNDGEIGEPRTCRDAKLLNLPSGVHTLDPDREGPSAARDVWCEQERRGGGWTLALKIEGIRSTFLADSSVWEDATLLNPASLDPSVPDEAKLAPYVDEEVAEILLVAGGGGDVVMRVRGSSLRALLASHLTFPTTTPDDEWLAAFPTAVLQQGCRRQGLGMITAEPPATSTQVRIGIMANNETDRCDSADSFLGVGGELACPAGQPTLAAGNVSNISPDLGCEPSRILVYVRGDDQTRFASQRSCQAHLELGRRNDGVYLVEGVPRRCDMTTDGGGWTNALDFDGVRDPCPAPWVADPMGERLCMIPELEQISTLVIPNPLSSYREVMAAVTGYQRSTSDAFHAPASIDGTYVDGLSITTGSPRQHLATFATGYSDLNGCGGPIALCNCPCLGGVSAPPFVAAEGYRCDAGALATPQDGILVRPDPLFDGAETPAACAAEASIDPIRAKLAGPTTTNLEARLMRDEVSQGEGLSIYRLALWVR